MRLSKPLTSNLLHVKLCATAVETDTCGVSLARRIALMVTVLSRDQLSPASWTCLIRAVHAAYGFAHAYRAWVIGTVFIRIQIVMCLSRNQIGQAGWTCLIRAVHTISGIAVACLAWVIGTVFIRIRVDHAADLTFTHPRSLADRLR